MVHEESGLPRNSTRNDVRGLLPRSAGFGAKTTEKHSVLLGLQLALTIELSPTLLLGVALAVALVVVFVIIISVLMRRELSMSQEILKQLKLGEPPESERPPSPPRSRVSNARIDESANTSLLAERQRVYTSLEKELRETKSQVRRYEGIASELRTEKERLTAEVTRLKDALESARTEIRAKGEQAQEVRRQLEKEAVGFEEERIRFEEERRKWHLVQGPKPVMPEVPREARRRLGIAKSFSNLLGRSTRWTTCSHCGRRVHSGDKFCDSCGNRLLTGD